MHSGRRGFYGWWALASTAVVTFVTCGGVLYSFAAFVPFIAQDFGWSSADVSGPFTVAIVLSQLSAPVAGALLKRYGPRRVIPAGGLCYALGLLVMQQMTSLPEFYLGFGLLIGLGAGFSGVIAADTVANNWFRRKVPLAMGLNVAAQGLGGIVLVPVVMSVITAQGWRGAYLALALATALFGVLLPALFLRNRPEDLGQVPDGAAAGAALAPPAFAPPAGGDFSLAEAAATPALWLLTLTLAAIFFMVGMVMAHHVAFLESIGLTKTMAASVLGVLLGCGSLGNLGFGLLALRMDMRRLAVVAQALMLCGMALNLMTHTQAMAWLAAVLFGLGFGGATVLGMSLISIWFGRKDFPRIVGTVMIVAAVGNLGPVIAGVIRSRTHSYDLAFAAGTAAALVALVAMLVVRRPARAAAHAAAAHQAPLTSPHL